MQLNQREMQREANAVTVIIAQLSSKGDSRYNCYAPILDKLDRAAAYADAMKLAHERGDKDIAKELREYPTV